MKKLIMVLMMLTMGLMHQAPTHAQDFGYDTYSYQANALCPMVVTVSAGDVGAPITVILQWGETVLQSGALDDGQSLDLVIPVDASWYLVIVQREAEDSGAYAVTSGLDCGQSEGASPALSMAEMVALRETVEPLLEAIQRIFAD